MGIKLWGNLDLEIRIQKLEKEKKDLKQTLERLLEENNNLLTIIKQLQEASKK